MISPQAIHPMLPRTTHDEAARQDFAMTLKQHLATKVSPHHKTIYEERVKPRFELIHGREPQDRHEILEAMTSDELFQLWGSLFRIGQELGWSSVLTSVDRQADAIAEQASKVQGACGALELAPDLEIPGYLEQIDFHAMPGGYHREFADDDLSAGALFDRGAYVYVAGHSGAMCDLMGNSLVAYIKANFPDLNPRRILDLGASVGHSTVPYVDAFPTAEVHAVDISAPLVRYGHARAAGLGKSIHFSQDNAEHTRFPDGHFDLIVSHILVHEIPLEAIKNVMAECRRLVARNGVTAHIDLSFYNDLDMFDSALLDWDTQFASEPYWDIIRKQDPIQLMTDAGFDADSTFHKNLRRNTSESPMFKSTKDSAGRGSWAVFGATR